MNPENVYEKMKTTGANPALRILLKFNTMFPTISPKQSFPALESEVLAFWKANNTFQKSMDSRPEDNPYRFYDGPPFITGTPHYGSLLSSIVKDVVGRYWTMRGRRVDRVWGWDCHGLPIEEKVQKKLWLKSNKDIEERGIKEFIDGCYEYTQSTSAEWDWYIDKIGRWVDMDRAYRTMDQDYMESVMWVFSQLWNKWLIYEGKRVSLYSWKLSTPISNFEVAMDDTYQEVNDPAITVKFAIEQSEGLIDKKEWGKFEYTSDGYLRYVLAVVKNEKWEYLMLKNKKHGGKWQCPGGKIDKWETPEDALKREIQEELWVNVTVWSKITEKKTIVNGTMWQGEYYNVVLDGAPSIQETHKHEKMEWVRLETSDNWYILVSETEKSEDQNFIRENFDIYNLVTDRPNIQSISILAWTTTPWTIPANMALAVRNDIDYILVENNGEGFIVAKNRAESVFKWKGEYTVIREFRWSELVGLSYIPPFPEYYHKKHGERNHKIYHADFITDTDGTGIGHEAPEFGDVDFQLAKKEGIYISEAMDEAGKYTSQIFDYEGTHYLNLEEPENGANRINIERMKANNTLFKLEWITHRVPFCPRSGTPLVQKAQSSWFIDIASQKDKLLKANEQINWFPEHLKFGRFAKWIESAPDWCISRTRFWWAPMPVWMGEDGEKIVISSREEIFELNKPYGQLEKMEIEGKVKYFFKWGEFDGVELNLHRPYIDSIKLQSPKTGNTLKRIPEVLDVWMDSGSMPYAQMHYPFANKEAMEASFPADFIAEYVWQVRAWFYVMHVLGVLLNPNDEPTPTPSFTNVITTGVINGNDGRKMSKSYGNYPDPRATIEKYGADPIRFYMLNSPLLSGWDMDFKEEQIIETVKWVMLPIWNTYSFFTTYANIDNWEKDSTEIWFSRHAESESNVAQKMSDGSDNPNLTEKGKIQAKNAGKALKEQGKNFDFIIHTDRTRAHDTAHIIGEEIGFTGEYVIEDGFAEQTAGEYANMTLSEIAKKWGLPEDAPHIELRKLYKNNSVENIDQFEKRIISAYQDVLKKYKGKRVLMVAHAGTPRPILHYYFGMDRDHAHYDTSIQNADPFQLMTTKLVNPLDRWILSKLQVLIWQVHDAMDGYDVSRACRAIVEYMDELTNWYVRLSRRRFWESGMTADKSSAYETLHTVLVEVSKLLAPYMPFLSESIFQWLTEKESVHLEYITRPNRHLVSSDLNRDMEICEHIVSLGLALRSQKNIRVRQPLQSVTITSDLSEYYKTIIRDELNVKEVKFENPERLAKKICKPDARKIGPRFGKEVQKVIMEAKNGNFVELSEEKIQVGEFILEKWEYTLEYLPLEWVGDVMGGYGMVVALDTSISQSLQLEWYARDLVRAIQEMRKEADYKVTDRIQISLTGEGSAEILTDFSEYIAGETLWVFASTIENPDSSKEEEISENMKITISIKR